MTDIIEAVARATYEFRHAGLKNCFAWDDSRLDDEHPWMRETYRREARVQVLATLKAIREPSEAMIDAGIPVICRGLPATETPLDQLCLAPDCDCYAKHGLKVVPAAYRAMIDVRIAEVAGRAEGER